ncbi:MAG TPA: BA14K family protein, partial [Hyphomicrobium sp.]|nr:BA14K family protein [Hyphomicrobium sp.]
IYWLRTWWGWEFWRPGPVVGGFIIGGVLVASAIAQHRATNDAIRNCAEDFPGFDPRTGTFVNESGERRVCPYLY